MHIFLRSFNIFQLASLKCSYYQNNLCCVYAIFIFFIFFFIPILSYLARPLFGNPFPHLLYSYLLCAFHFKNHLYFSLRHDIFKACNSFPFYDSIFGINKRKFSLLLIPINALRHVPLFLFYFYVSFCCISGSSSGYKHYTNDSSGSFS